MAVVGEKPMAIDKMPGPRLDVRARQPCPCLVLLRRLRLTVQMSSQYIDARPDLRVRRRPWTTTS
jgi:hypothetical protein